MLFLVKCATRGECIEDPAWPSIVLPGMSELPRREPVSAGDLHDIAHHGLLFPRKLRPRDVTIVLLLQFPLVALRWQSGGLS